MPPNPPAANPHAGSTPSVHPAANKLLGPEILRFLCAVSVLVWHYQHFAFVNTKLGADFATTGQPLFALFAPMYRFGYSGVQIFWCISGFIFYWKYRNVVHEGELGPGRFFVLRLSRLYPLHVITLLIVAILQMVYMALHGGASFVYPYNDPHHFHLQLFMASHWGMQLGDSFNGPIWSISIEVLIYALFYCVTRLLGGRAWVPVAVIAVAFVAWGLGVRRMDGPYRHIIDCAIIFHAGGLAAIALQRWDGTERAALMRRLAFAGLVGATALAALASFRVPSKDIAIGPPFLLVAIPLVLYLISGRGAGRWLADRGEHVQHWIETAGNVTYASYLLHFPMQMTFVMACGAMGVAVPWREPWLLIAYLASVLSLSVLTYRRLEMPLQALVREQLLPGGRQPNRRRRPGDARPVPPARPVPSGFALRGRRHGNDTIGSASGHPALPMAMSGLSEAAVAHRRGG